MYATNGHIVALAYEELVVEALSAKVCLKAALSDSCPSLCLRGNPDTMSACLSGGSPRQSENKSLPRGNVPSQFAFSKLFKNLIRAEECMVCKQLF